VAEPVEPKAVVDPRKYKTRMCTTWQETGSCPYEHTCCFAHGPTELRDLSSNHKLLASIGYFSNVILLAMSNGEKPALPPHALYEQPTLFQAPQTAEELKAFTQSLPKDLKFPFQDVLPGALSQLAKAASATCSSTGPEPDPSASPLRRRSQSEGGNENIGI
jgi:hypothetical protein